MYKAGEQSGEMKMRVELILVDHLKVDAAHLGINLAPLERNFNTLESGALDVYQQLP